MLLVNVDDVLRLTNSNIRHENAVSQDNEFIFFDTDKFTNNLSQLKPTSIITPEILLEVFNNSFTTGKIDYSRD